MKPCSSNYARISKPQKGAANSASGSQLSTPSHTLATGKDGVHAIVAYARIFSICAAAPSSTICMSWLVPSNFLLSFRTLLDYLTDALEREDGQKIDLKRLVKHQKYGTVREYKV